MKKKKLKLVFTQTSIEMASKILIVSDEQKQAIRENVNLDDKIIKDNVDDILEWFKGQPHLPQTDLDPRVVECILLSRKGSVEQTKQKIDMMYAIKNFIPEMVAIRDVRDPKIINALKGCTYTVLPKLNHDFTRVSIIQYKDVNFFDVTDIANFVWTVSEYRMLNDYFAGERYIFDLKDFTIAHFTKYTPNLIKNMELFVRKGFGMRIFGIHMINAPTLVNKFLAIAKMALSDKINSRINIHSKIDDLFNVIDKEILPADFSGNEPSVNEILETWKQELGKEEIREYLLAQQKLKSDESLRVDKSILDEELLSAAGSFKKLELD